MSKSMISSSKMSNAIAVIGLSQLGGANANVAPTLDEFKRTAVGPKAKVFFCNQATEKHLTTFAGVYADGQNKVDHALPDFNLGGFFKEFNLDNIVKKEEIEFIQTVGNNSQDRELAFERCFNWIQTPNKILKDKINFYETTPDDKQYQVVEPMFQYLDDRHTKIGLFGSSKLKKEVKDDKYKFTIWNPPAYPAVALSVQIEKLFKTIWSFNGFAKYMKKKNLFNPVSLTYDPYRFKDFGEGKKFKNDIENKMTDEKAKNSLTEFYEMAKKSLTDWETKEASWSNLTFFQAQALKNQHVADFRKKVEEIYPTVTTNVEMTSIKTLDNSHNTKLGWATTGKSRPLENALKALNMFGPAGSHADIGTLVCMLMKNACPEANDVVSEMKAIIQAIENFKQNKATDLLKLVEETLPTHMAIDLEYDDLMAWEVVEFLHWVRRTTNTNSDSEVQVVVQIEKDTKLAQVWENELAAKTGTILLEDERASNALEAANSVNFAVNTGDKLFWGKDLNKKYNNCRSVDFYKNDYYGESKKPFQNPFLDVNWVKVDGIYVAKPNLRGAVIESAPTQSSTDSSTDSTRTSVQ